MILSIRGEWHSLAAPVTAARKRTVDWALASTREMAGDIGIASALVFFALTDQRLDIVAPYYQAYADLLSEG